MTHPGPSLVPSPNQSNRLKIQNGVAAASHSQMALSYLGSLQDDSRFQGLPVSKQFTVVWDLDTAPHSCSSYVEWHPYVMVRHPKFHNLRSLLSRARNGITNVEFFRRLKPLGLKTAWRDPELIRQSLCFLSCKLAPDCSSGT